MQSRGERCSKGVLLGGVRERYPGIGVLNPFPGADEGWLAVIDTIFEGGCIYDGLGSAPLTTDLAVVGDRIALVGDLRERDAHTRVDARGMALAPGFIDAHSLSDELWLVDPRCAGKVMQGVTTEIGGNCGSSVAPLQGLARTLRSGDLKPYGIEVEWSTLDGFLSLVERNPPALNVATLVGLGTARRCVRGDDDGKLDAAELAAECALVREAVEQGAVGVSSGLIYVPSRFAGLEELIACAAAARDAGAPLYASH